MSVGVVVRGAVRELETGIIDWRANQGGWRVIVVAS